jgi:hypothetical protein
MPTIVDSLFLELGVDVSRFTQDQQKTLAKIHEFETRAKRAGKGGADAIKTVGSAFRDLARDSSIGSGIARIETLSSKVTGLGKSLSVAGGIGEPLGAAARGLGALLSPAALGIAALGMLGKATWNFNADMTAMNATLSRNAELAGLSASKLWAMGQAAKTTGGNPAAVIAGIDSLQTSLAGASIGVGDASAQMTGMARLAAYGARYRKGGFGSGVDEESLFKAVRNMYLAQGRARTMALVTGYGLMSQDQADLAVSAGGYEEYRKALAKAKAMTAGGGFDAVVRKSLQSQVGLGEKDIAAAITAEQAYGGIQQPMQTMVGLLTNIYGILNATLGYIARIANFLHVPSVKDTTKAAVNTLAGAIGLPTPFAGAVHAPDSLPKSAVGRAALAMKDLMAAGEPSIASAAMVGSLWHESNLDPLARNASGMAGIMQWNRSRQANFEKQFGYPMADTSPGARSREQQFADQLNFMMLELRTSEGKTARALAAADGNLAKSTLDFFRLDERANDNSFGRRLNYATVASQLPQISDALRMLSAGNVSSRMATTNDNRSDTRIGDIHITTSATNGRDFATDFRNGLLAQPLFGAIAQQQAVLATRGKVL